MASIERTDPRRRIELVVSNRRTTGGTFPRHIAFGISDGPAFSRRPHQQARPAISEPASADFQTSDTAIHSASRRSLLHAECFSLAIRVAGREHRHTTSSPDQKSALSFLNRDCTAGLLARYERVGRTSRAGPAENLTAEQSPRSVDLVSVPHRRCATLNSFADCP